MRIWRKYRGLTAGNLAAEVSISKAYLSEIESGKRSGSVAVLALIVKALTVDMDDLMPRKRGLILPAG